jgi:hypothetical protein
MVNQGTGFVVVVAVGVFVASVCAPIELVARFPLDKIRVWPLQERDMEHTVAEMNALGTILRKIKSHVLD